MLTSANIFQAVKLIWYLLAVKADCDKCGVAFDYHQTGSNFVMNNKRYRINHHDEYKQAKKAMEYMKKEENHDN